MVITNNGHSAFVSNTGSGTISSYDLTSNDGTLTLVILSLAMRVPAAHRSIWL